MLGKIHAAEPETKVVVEMGSGFRWRPWVAAAVVLGLAITGYWLVINNRSENHQLVIEEKPALNDVAPGRDGAILTLADGTKIVLDDKKDGAIAQNATKEGGRIVYSASSAEGSDLQYHLMTTPKGRTYHVQLSDGSVVWLNAASSLYYPTVFDKNERRVEVTGEAYFEVAKDPSRKFIVVAKNLSTEVLGTSFNVNTYEDEADAKVTLLEGRIQLKTSASSVVLKPGQQASVSLQPALSNDIKVRPDADIEQVMAWKNGLFKFQSTPLEEMMKQIARWYDVEISFESSVKKDDTISGTMNRHANASETLAILTTAGYNFRIEGKKITVMP